MQTQRTLSGILVAVVLTLLPRATVYARTQGNVSSSVQAQELRFAVVHAHFGNNCAGYLYVSQESVRYEEAVPGNYKNHSFQIPHAAITAVQPWILLGQPQNVVEIKAAQATYHFWVLPMGADLNSARSSNLNLIAAPAQELIAAIRNPKRALEQTVAKATVPVAGTERGSTENSDATADGASTVARNKSSAKRGLPPAGVDSSGDSDPTAANREAPYKSGAALGQSSDDQLVPLPRPQGPSRTHGAVRYVAPAGWTVQGSANGATVLTGPVKREELPCEIRMMPPMSMRGDPATIGATIVQQAATANRLGQYTDSSGRDVRLSREEGVAGTGWAYTDLSGQLGNSGITARVLMVRMGDQLLPIVGYSKTWNCLGNQAVRDNDVWALFFHSLQVPGYASESPELAQELIGQWMSASGSAGNSYTFAPNGRFGSVSVYLGYAASSTPGMVWEIDKSWKGDGPYTVHGDRLHMQNPNGSETTKDETRFFSIVRMPNDKKPDGFDLVLRVVERSWDGSDTWGFKPGGNYVLSLRKSNPAGR
jgi:hypothetical protein